VQTAVFLRAAGTVRGLILSSTASRCASDFGPVCKSYKVDRFTSTKHQKLSQLCCPITCLTLCIVVQLVICCGLVVGYCRLVVDCSGLVYNKSKPKLPYFDSLNQISGV